MIEVEIGNTGEIAEFPDGTPPEVIEQALAEHMAANDATNNDRSIVDRAAGEIVGGVETVGAVAAGLGTEALAGLSGILALPFVGGAQAGGVVEGVRANLQKFLQPSQPETVRNLNTLAKILSPLTRLQEAGEEFLGEKGNEVAGPVGGAVGETLPTVAEILIPVKGSKAARSVAASGPNAREAQILEAGKEFDVPVLTSDVKPPQTAFGNFVQKMNDKLGVLGSGSARVSQQRARIAAIEGYIDEMDIDIDSPFASDIVASLNNASSRRLKAAGNVRSQAVNALNTHGNVPTDKAQAVIQRLRDEQAALGETANPAITSLLDRFDAELKGDKNFESLKNQRTQAIKERNKFDRSEDTSPRDAAQAIKSAIDKDLMSFARKNDRVAARQWLESNRQFANEYAVTKRTELKRILEGGEATPEKVLSILRGGKPSELKRLNNSLTDKGRASARAAVIQNALEKSGWPSQINPDRFASALSKPNAQKAIAAFFGPQDKKQIDGLTRLLDATRRAQQAKLLPETGAQLVPFAGAGALTALGKVDPVLTGLGAATISGFAKAYESKGFRTMLIKLANTKKGSKKETELLDTAIPAVLLGSMAATEAQEDTTQ